MLTFLLVVLHVISVTFSHITTIANSDKKTANVRLQKINKVTHVTYNEMIIAR